ncbi:MAG: hypothetical protein WD599_01640 [Balneolaceae bacterium]
MQFQGFSPVFSSVLLILLLGCILLLTWWSYSYLKSISPVKKWGLIFLRGFAFFILILLLLNPFLEFSEVNIQQPEIAVYLDDSKSMNVTRGEYQGWESYREMIEAFNFDQFNDEATISFYRFDDRVEPLDDTGPVPELNLDGGVTNLDEVIRHIRDQMSQARATLLFSDGIVTRGRDPVYNARQLPGPIFTVPVGDTARIQDIAITEVMTNETGYTNTRQPVDLTVRQYGFIGETATIQLRKDEEVLESTQITFTADPSSHSISFELTFEDTGLQNYDIHIPALEGEQTTENNQFPFSVEILDDQTRVLHLAFEIHPDVRTIRTLLQTDQSLDVETKTWLGNRFIEGSLEISEDSGEYDLIVIQGHPPENLGELTQLMSNAPVLQILTPNVDASNLENSAVPLSVSNPGSMKTLQLRVNPQQQNHPVMEFEPVNFPRMPPLQTREGNLQTPVTSHIHFFANFSGSETNIPILITDETGNQRNTLLNAFGWFRFAQSQEDEPRQFIRTLITNLVSWTSTSPDRRNLQIAPLKRIFQETESVQFRASLTNESGEPESDAVIEVVITHEDETEYNYTMRNRGQGNYDLSAGRLVAGNYDYQAHARKTGRTIDEYGGSFNVTESTIEFVNTERNDALLRQLAEASGGYFIEEASSGNLRTELAERDLLDPVEEHRTMYRYLYENLIWFVLVLILLSGEWILRRSLALP